MRQRVVHCATLTPSIIAVVSKLLDRAPYTAVMHNGHPGGKSEKVLTRFINGGLHPRIVQPVGGLSFVLNDAVPAA